MRATKIPHPAMEKQWEFETKRFEQAKRQAQEKQKQQQQQVYCPMCEDWHINDTQCQRYD